MWQKHPARSIAVCFPHKPPKCPCATCLSSPCHWHVRLSFTQRSGELPKPGLDLLWALCPENLPRAGSSRADVKPEPGVRQECASLHLWWAPLTTHDVPLWDVIAIIHGISISFWISQRGCLWLRCWLQLTGTRLKQHHPGNLDQTSYTLPWIKLLVPGSLRHPPKFIFQYLTLKACFHESWALSPSEGEF